MCGIIGISGPFDFNALQAGVHAIAHRGPDDCGVFTDQQAQVGLGHTRLSILELSALGHQPLLTDDSQVALVFNGEIYNFRELRAELEQKGHQFKGHSDTEVVLQLYLAEGDAMLSRLNGIFALGLWDARRGSLLVARDALGVKPVYVFEGDASYAFASEIKALQHLIPVQKALDYAAIDRYLTYQWCPGAGTPFTNVKKLEPGEAVWVTSGRVVKRLSWYTLPVVGKTPRAMSESDAIQGVQNYVRQAVHRQMVADVPVGAFLSGGLDSSSVVAFAKELDPDVRCFTIESVGGQESGTTDDVSYARQVAHHLKVPLEVVTVDSASMAADLEQMIYQLDEPLADPAPLNVLYISRLAREKGIKVLLSGAGGDDIFSGYRRHLALKSEHYWAWLPKGVRAAVEALTAGLDQRKPLFRRMTKAFSGAALEGDARLVNYFRWANKAELSGLYTPAFREALGCEQAEAPMLDFLTQLPATASPLDRMLALEQRFFLPDHNLTYTDKMSMAVGLEVRVPLLDLDLLNFANQIPDHLKQCGTHSKWIFKKAMEPYLPKGVIYRPKTGFGAPLRRWMRYELRELLGDMLSVDSLKRRGLFEPQAVQNMIKSNDAGQIDASYTLLSLLAIEIWCRAFIDHAAENNTKALSTI